jgi:hypothetical protein
METEKAIQLLRDEKVFPSEDMLMGAYYGVYREYVDSLSVHGISVDWRYYKDGKAWLGKAVRGAKTVCWISLWEGFFRVSFYFATRLKEELEQSIDTEFLDRAMRQSPVGKLLPIVVEVSDQHQVAELMEIVAFKLKFK